MKLPPFSNVARAEKQTTVKTGMGQKVTLTLDHNFRRDIDIHIENVIDIPGVEVISGITSVKDDKCYVLVNNHNGYDIEIEQGCTIALYEEYDKFTEQHDVINSVEEMEDSLKNKGINDAL